MKIIPVRPKLNLNFPILQSKDAVYLSIPKCASTTIRSAIGQWRTAKTAISLEAARDYGTRICVIRHPVDRLRSAWNHNWSRAPWDEFVDHVCQDPDWDIHTARYAERADAANIVMTTESLTKTWVQARQLCEGLPNVTQKLNIRVHAAADAVSPATEKILSAYSDDFAIWLEATRSGGGILLK